MLSCRQSLIYVCLKNTPVSPVVVIYRVLPIQFMPGLCFPSWSATSLIAGDVLLSQSVLVQSSPYQLGQPGGKDNFAPCSQMNPALSEQPLIPQQGFCDRKKQNPAASTSYATMKDE